MLFAEAGILSEVAALLAAIGGLIVAFVGLIKYLDERRKRKAAEHKLEELLAQIRQLQGDSNKSLRSGGEPQAPNFHAQLDDILKHLNESTPVPR